MRLQRFVRYGVVGLIVDFQQQLASRDEVFRSKEERLQSLDHSLHTKDTAIRQRDAYIQLLEEKLRLTRAQQIAASSEKHTHQIHLFDEAEMEVKIEALVEQLPDEVEVAAPKTAKSAANAASPTLVGEPIVLTLSEEEKGGDDKVLFTKVKGELEFIPVQLKVLET